MADCNSSPSLTTAHDDLPQIAFGPHRISRLILGANPINGGSHLSRFVNQQMRRYFTPERVLELLRACQEAGINTWQSGPQNLDLYRHHRQQGGRLHYISLAMDDPEDPDVITRIVEAGAIAIAHHGEVTDVMFKSGQIDRLPSFLRRVREAGVLVGISTHMPAVVDYVEDKGWDVDFYLTCVYERHRTREELKAMLGYVPIPVPEVYLEEDPPRMFAAMQRTRILAAGRLCDRQEMVEQAFETTFRQIKPNDAVIVGMYPEYEDQVRLNSGYVRRFSDLSTRTGQPG